MDEDPFATRMRPDPVAPPEPPAPETEDPFATGMRPDPAAPPEPPAPETEVEEGAPAAETQVKPSRAARSTRVGRRAPADAPGAPAPPPAAPVPPAPAAATPLWQPPAERAEPAATPRARAPWALVGAALVVVAGAGFAAGWLSRGSGGGAVPTSTPAPFLVTGLSAKLAPGRLACPSAVAHLSGTIRTDHGGGTISYQWLLPGGSSTTPAALTFAANQTVGVATLAYTLTGRGSLAGPAMLHVLSPLSAYSAPVHIRYACAAKKR